MTDCRWQACEPWHRAPAQGRSPWGCGGISELRCDTHARRRTLERRVCVCGGALCQLITWWVRVTIRTCHCIQTSPSPPRSLPAQGHAASLPTATLEPGCRWSALPACDLVTRGFCTDGTARCVTFGTRPVRRPARCPWALQAADPRRRGWPARHGSGGALLFDPSAAKGHLGVSRLDCYINNYAKPAGAGFYVDVN